MTCQEALARLDDFVDGELGEAGFQEVELHLEGCTACQKGADALRALVAQAASLPRELEPPHDLWGAVARRIETAAPVARMGFGHMWVWRSLAAAAALVLVASWWGFGVRRQRRAPTPYAGTVQPVSFDQEKDYDRAATELVAALDARRDALTPEARARVDESLRVITEALAAIRSELAKDPGDPRLNHLLLSVHQRRIEVLRTLVRLTA
jgi:hypothetical protein